MKKKAAPLPSELARSLEELARSCGWAPSRVPRAWRGLPAGALYDCPDKRVGQSISKGGRSGQIVACATPLPLSRSQGKSRAYRCQGAYGVQWAGELMPVPVRKSQVREAGRSRAMCDRAGRLTVGQVEAWREEGLRSAEDVRRVGQLPAGDLPFPHRRGGHVACHYAPLAEELRALTKMLESKLAPRARAAVRREWEAERWPPGQRAPRAEVEALAVPRARQRAEERAARSELGRQLEELRAMVWDAKINAALTPRSGYRAERARLVADQERRAAVEDAIAESMGRSVEVQRDTFAEELRALELEYGRRKGARR